MSAERSVARLQEDCAWSLAIRVRRPVDLARVGWHGVESRNPGTTPGHGKRGPFGKSGLGCFVNHSVYAEAPRARFGSLPAKQPGLWQPSMVRWAAVWSLDALRAGSRRPPAQLVVNCGLVARKVALVVLHGADS